MLSLLSSATAVCTCSGLQFPPLPSPDTGQMSQATLRTPQIRAEPPVHWDTPLTSTIVLKRSLYVILW